MQRLFLVRGLPGSGKSTLGRDLAPAFCFAADDYFMVGGEYRFVPAHLPAAHADCQARTRAALVAGATVAVCNTFTQRWELEPYLSLARDLNVPCVVLDLFDGGLTDAELANRNDHGVSVETITGMRGRYERDWWNGNPTPPWERK
jgi:predicted kinase